MTPVARTNQVANDVLLERINNLQQDVTRIISAVDASCNSQREFEKYYTEQHALVVNEAAAAHRRLDLQQKQIDTILAQMAALSNAMQPLIFQAKILNWFAISLGGSVLLLIIAVITHQVTLTFP